MYSDYKKKKKGIQKDFNVTAARLDDFEAIGIFSW